MLSRLFYMRVSQKKRVPHSTLDLQKNLSNETSVYSRLEMYSSVQLSWNRLLNM